MHEKVFNSFILAKNNVRSLRGESILILLENMYLYDFMNKDALLNILPNISTLVDENLDLVLEKAYNNHNSIQDDLPSLQTSGITTEEMRIRNLAIR